MAESKKMRTFASESNAIVYSSHFLSHIYLTQFPDQIYSNLSDIRPATILFLPGLSL